MSCKKCKYVKDCKHVDYTKTDDFCKRREYRDKLKSITINANFKRGN